VAKKQDLNRRLDAVEALVNDVELQDELRGHFSGLPDLERMLSRVHSGTIRLTDVLRLLDALQTLRAVFAKHGASVSMGEHPSTLLDRLLGREEDASIYSPLDEIVELCARLDLEQSKSDSRIVPRAGFDQAYDSAHARQLQVEQQLDQYLVQLRKEIGTAKMRYVHNTQGKYQIELPNSVRNVPSQLSALKK
jgi:DNA mismatch repair protein MSH6